MSKEDLWLRLFNSDFFDEWLALSYIHQKPAGGVHEYLCNRLFALPDNAVEDILSQLCELAVRPPTPSASVQRALVGLAGRSTRTALKVYWLLRTISQDQRDAGKAVHSLLQACEEAALHVHSPVCGTLAPGDAPGAPERNRRAPRPADGRGGADAVSDDARMTRLSRQLGGDGEGVTHLVKASLDDLSSGGTGLLSRSPPRDPAPAPPASALSARRFRATLTFLDLVCTCSASLTPMPPPQRASALRRRLEDLNARLLDADLQSQVLWPMARGHARVARVVPDRAAIMNSRERVPFLLFVETVDFPDALAANRDSAPAAAPPRPPTAATSGGGVTPEALAASMAQWPRENPGLLWDQAQPLAGAAASVPPDACAGDPAPLPLPEQPPSHGSGSGVLDRPASPSTPRDAGDAHAEPLALGELLSDGAPTPQGSGLATLGSGMLPRNASDLSAQRPDSGAAPSLARHGDAAPVAAATLPPRHSALAASLEAGLSGRVPSAEALERMISSMHVSALREPAARGLRMSVHSASADAASGGGGAAAVSLPTCAADHGALLHASDAARVDMCAPGTASRTSSPTRELSSGLPSDAPPGDGALQCDARGTDADGAPASPCAPPPPATHAALGDELNPTCAGDGAAAVVLSSERADLRPNYDAAAAAPSPVPPDASPDAVSPDHPAAALDGVLRSPPRSGGAAAAPSLDHAAAGAAASIASPSRPLELPAASRASTAPSLTGGSAAGADDADSAGSWVNVGADGSAEPADRPAPASTGATVRALTSGGAAARPPRGAERVSAAASDAGASAADAAAAAAVARELDALSREAYMQHVHGAALADVVGRIKAVSPYATCPGWTCQAVIVKSGDDCRQELLAMQLIRMFRSVFAAEGLPHWLLPYEVLPTSHQTALIEFLPNCASIHSIKRSLPPGSTLASHFFRLFPCGSPACDAAQRRFAESLAGYSLVCYLLQIKDRHNGNIMLDAEGRLIHIDFGFMLSNSPGGVAFERAPFKLTSEYLHILGSDARGRRSPAFDYFRRLWASGYEAAAKHGEKVVQLVDIMQRSGCPCFAAGKRSLDALRKRFRHDAAAVESLVTDSVDAWTTRQYDYYQRVTNGIL